MFILEWPGPYGHVQGYLIRKSRSIRHDLLHAILSHPPTNVIFKLSGFQTFFLAIWLIPATISALGMLKINKTTSLEAQGAVFPYVCSKSQIRWFSRNKVFRAEDDETQILGVHTRNCDRGFSKKVKKSSEKYPLKTEVKS